MKRLACTIAVFTLLQFVAAKAAESLKADTSSHSYAVYKNDRYAYSIEYPKDLFVGQGESGSGDGQTFRNAATGSEFAVWGALAIDFPGSDELTYATAYNKVLKETPGTTYKAKGPHWFVFSGYDNKGIFYKKTIFMDGQLKTLLIEYPRKEKETMDPIVKKLAASFR